MPEDAAARRRRKRRTASIGHVIEVMLSNGQFRYLQYCCEGEHGQVVRVLPGPVPHPLTSQEVESTTAGEDEFLSLCFLDDYVRGEGIEIVANLPVPESRRGPIPVVIVWSPTDPDMGWISDGSGASMLISDFIREHPDIDIESLPDSGIGHPFRLEDGARRHVKAVPPPSSAPIPGQGRAIHPLSPSQEALAELHSQRSSGLVADLRETFTLQSVTSVVDGLNTLDKEMQKSVIIALFIPIAGKRQARLALAASPNERSDWLRRELAPTMIRQSVLCKLGGRRLPWTADELELLCALFAPPLSSEDAPFLLGVLRQFLSKNARDSQVVDAVAQLVVRLDALEPNRIGAVGPLKALLTSQLPEGELDRSLFDRSDCFGAPARQLAEELATVWPRTADAITHFVSARGSKPSKKWLSMSADLGSDTEFSELVRGLCSLITTVDLTDVGVPSERLLSGGNEYMARGAVWSVPYTSGAWRIETLAHVALRCGAKPSTISGVICSSVSLAAIDSLAAALDDPLATDELERLLAEAPNAGLLKKIGSVIGASDDRIAVELKRLRSQRRSDIERPWLGRWH